MRACLHKQDAANVAEAEARSFQDGAGYTYEEPLQRWRLKPLPGSFYSANSGELLIRDPTMAIERLPNLRLRVLQRCVRAVLISPFTVISSFISSMSAMHCCTPPSMP